MGNIYASQLSCFTPSWIPSTCMIPKTVCTCIFVAVNHFISDFLQKPFLSWETWNTEFFFVSSFNRTITSEVDEYSQSAHLHSTLSQAIILRQDWLWGLLLVILIVFVFLWLTWLFPGSWYIWLLSRLVDITFVWLCTH